MKKYSQYSLLSLFGVMALLATGWAIRSWQVHQPWVVFPRSDVTPRSDSTLLSDVSQIWMRNVDQFEKRQTRLHKPTEEVEILVRLMRQNPQHALWKEFEYSPIFSGDRVGYLAPYISWPQQTIQLGDESVHILTSQHPCNSRRLVVHTDAASRILDIKSVDDILAYEKLGLQVNATNPQPVLRLSYRQEINTNSKPVVLDLTLDKSSVQGLDPAGFKIMDRQPE